MTDLGKRISNIEADKKIESANPGERISVINKIVGYLGKVNPKEEKAYIRTLSRGIGLLNPSCLSKTRAVYITRFFAHCFGRIVWMSPFE